MTSAFRCDYEGRFKVVSPSGHVSRLFCRGHADDWRRKLDGRMIVEPRNVDGSVLFCEGDWVLPGMVPG